MKSTPVPFKETLCGLPAALSVTVSVPFDWPLACGANVTEMVQFAPPARVAGQWLVCAKGALVEMPLMFRLISPVFVSVTSDAELVVPTVNEPKLRATGLKETAAGASPVPLSVMDCGLPLAVSVICSGPLTGPRPVGVNATVMVHEAPPTRVPKQFVLGTLNTFG